MEKLTAWLILQYIARVAEQIHSEPHTVIPGVEQHQLAIDVEAHKGSDGKYYMLDFARAFPPEDPHIPTPKLSSSNCSPWFRMLRPELVDRFYAETGKRLSHDVLTLWDKSVVNLRNIKDATRLLHTSVIPQFAALLQIENMYERIVQVGDLDLTEEAHKRGINMRHIGRVRSASQSAEIKMILLSEMAARALKNELNERLRKQVEQQKVPLSQPYRATTLAFLREFLCTSTRSEVETSTHFWSVNVKPWLKESFPKGLSDEEGKTDFDLRAMIHASYFIERFQKLTASTCCERGTTSGTSLADTCLILTCTAGSVKLSQRLIDEFRIPELMPQPLYVFDRDLKKMGARVKQLSLADMARAHALLEDATNSSFYAGEKVWELMSENFRKSVASSPSSENLLYWALGLYLHASAREEYEMEENKHTLRQTLWTDPQKLHQLYELAESKAYDAVRAEAEMSHQSRQSVLTIALHLCLRSKYSRSTLLPRLYQSISAVHGDCWASSSSTDIASNTRTRPSCRCISMMLTVRCLSLSLSLSLSPSHGVWLPYRCCTEPRHLLYNSMLCESRQALATDLALVASVCTKQVRKEPAHHEPRLEPTVQVHEVGSLAPTHQARAAALPLAHLSR